MARILIIDDDEEIRLVLRDVLEDAGYEVVEAEDGQEGLQYYRTAPADLIITDIVMPRKGGLETIRELRREAPHVKIIAISGGSRTASLSGLDIARQLGATRVFQKPFGLPEMCRAVREVLQEEGQNSLAHREA
jgi:CheY-like chemotaxis protein